MVHKPTTPREVDAYDNLSKVGDGEKERQWRSLEKSPWLLMQFSGFQA